MDLVEALEVLEKRKGIHPPLGVGELPRSVRYNQILLFLRKAVCPHSEEIAKRLRSEESSLGTIIGDLILAHFTGLPVPASTIAKSIAVVGLKRFCKDPTSILSN
jgi:hypothetical protein